MTYEQKTIEVPYALQDSERHYGLIYIHGIYYEETLLNDEIVNQLRGKIDAKQKLQESQEKLKANESKLKDLKGSRKKSAADQVKIDFMTEFLKSQRQEIEKFEGQIKDGRDPEFAQRVYREIAVTLFLKRELSEAARGLLVQIFGRLSVGDEAKDVMGLENKHGRPPLPNDQIWGLLCVYKQLQFSHNLSGRQASRLVADFARDRNANKQAFSSGAGEEEAVKYCKEHFLEKAKEASMVEVCEQALRANRTLAWGPGYERLVLQIHPSKPGK
jgi:hypothetical protein